MSDAPPMTNSPTRLRVSTPADRFSRDSIGTSERRGLNLSKCCLWVKGLSLLFLTACTSEQRLVATAAGPAPSPVAAPPPDTVIAPASRRASAPEDEPGDKSTPLLDRTQRGVHGAIGSLARSFDSFFGETDLDAGANVTRGSLSAAGRWDERNGFDERIRLQARIAMPALKERTRLIIGRGDAEEFTDGTVTDDVGTLPARFGDFEDDDWLLGVGYSRNQRLSDGWDFSLGVKVATPLEPYVRATYRWNRTLTDSILWRMRPRLFVQNQRGLGASFNSTVDYALNERWLLRNETTLQAEDEIEGLAWTHRFTGFQSRTDKSGFSYAIFATGETRAEVPLIDYGLEVRFRRRIAREWLFIELFSFVTWPREFDSEERHRNPGLGLELEMQFGDWPGRGRL